MRNFLSIMVVGCLAASCGDNSATDTADTGKTDQGAASTAAAPEDFHFIPGTFVPQIGPDGNTEIYSAPNGLVVVDTGRHKTHSQQILDYATQEGQPITIIINTHWHLDHSTGNQDLTAVYPEAKLYTTLAIHKALSGFLVEGLSSSEERLKDPNLPADARARLTRGLNTIKHPDSLIPDVPVQARMSLPVDGRDLELNVTDHAVTQSDVWIWDPATKTVIAGDIVTLPVPFFDTACPEGWLAAFEDIDKKPYERVVPGHGFIMNAAEFRTYRDAFRNLVACAAEKTSEECAEGWLADAATLLDKEPDADFASKDYARRGAVYYVDNILKSDAKHAQFCTD